jgi:hypothetical protein
MSPGYYLGDDTLSPRSLLDLISLFFKNCIDAGPDSAESGNSDSQLIAPPPEAITRLLIKSIHRKAVVRGSREGFGRAKNLLQDASCEL